ncbi:LAETG motif-containing sortase-dependent surface protein [Streptomyces dubilierae]|uniref:LAETG motif-containing sortase-dependent surface protein n=1 Tax=Streptomyces dubilierae TaxID=3075533 RepID=A0ABU2PJP5_9ACTN|nr:LAETG motif-containing sortase-dependent surface protein [Streptomyces sp. DSM 41921]MDT0392394.1 LAETG motif-containing sortase-dependent surface protein [Streptomyces sp. DSM 41921]
MHLRPPAAVLAAAVIAVAGPAVAAPLAHAEEGGPDLVVSTLPAASLKPGEVYDETVTLTNKGTAAVDGVTFRVRLTRGLDFPEQVKGCTYSTVQEQVRQALCELDTVVEPGASVTTPVRFKALGKALMEAVEYGTSASGDAPGEGYDDSHRRMTLTADNTADLVAVGEDTEALAGEQQSVTVTLRNDGPGWVQNQDSDDLPGLLVQIPPGTTAVEVPKDCAPFGIDGPSAPQGTPGKPKYVCWPANGTLDVGQSLAYTFLLQVKESAQDPEGKVTASSVYGIAPAYDKNRANNTALIRIDLPSDYEPGPSPSDGTDGGGDGGDGNAPEGQAAGGTGATESPSATAPAGTTGGSGGTSSGGATGGNLAATGSDGTPLIAGAAAAAAVVGGALVFAVRRRSAAGSA